MDARAFVLVQPPFEAAGEAVGWAQRSTEFAFAAGATVVTLIPVRPGNGALEALQAAGQFTPPTLDTLEDALDASLAAAAGRGRVFADLWDLEVFSRCRACFAERRERLASINRTQRSVAGVGCPVCGQARG